MRIDIISDTVCPWCYVGKRHLEQAMSQRPDVDIQMHWQPFQLNPDMPMEGADRKSYWRKKFGDEQRIAAMTQRLVDIGQDLDLAFAFDKIQIQSNTLKSHVLLHWQDGQSVQNELKEAILNAFFMQGLDIGDDKVLVKIAEKCGLDSGVAQAVLVDQKRFDAVRELDSQARKMGISGVPTYFFEGQSPLVGAQPVDALVEAIDHFS